jgi:Ca2+-binding EF-hand superfamily protein
MTACPCQEFVMATNMSSCTSAEDKLRWAFKMYDKDGSGEHWRSGCAAAGTIDMKEMVGDIVEEILEDTGEGIVKEMVEEIVEIEEMEEIVHVVSFKKFRRIRCSTH